MLFSFGIDSNSSKKRYVQLADFVRSLIQNGNLQPNEKLPGQRQLVKLLDVSRTTVIKAFEMLVEEGLILAKPRSGYVVVKHSSSKNNQPDWEEYKNNAKFRPGMKDYHLWSQSGGLGLFALGESFNTSIYISKAVKHTSSKKLSNYEKEFTICGLQSLRQSLVDHLGTFGVNTTVDNILICPSVTSASSIIYPALATFGTNFLHEKPNLINTISDIHSLGMNMVDIPIDEYGLSAQALNDTLHKYKKGLLHTDPCDQCPSGVVMTHERREALMKVVRAHKLPVIEIDHMRDSWHDKPFPNPLKSFKGGENVLYLGSFIRSYPMDLRIGWIVANKPLIQYLANVMIQMDIRPSLITQVIADELFRTGEYDTMMKGVRAFIKERKESALYYCDKYLKGIARWNEKNCGFHFWLDFPDKCVRPAFKSGILTNCYPGSFFDKNDTNHVLLCPPSLKCEELEPAIRSLAEKCQ